MRRALPLSLLIMVHLQVASLPLASPSCAAGALSLPATTLDSPGVPGEGSGMPTTTAIYDRLVSGAVMPPTSNTFTEPAAGPLLPTGRTLAEIQGKLPVPDESNGAIPAEVAAGKSFWGLRPDSTWGPQVGTGEFVPAPGVSCASPAGNSAFPVPMAPGTNVPQALATPATNLDSPGTPEMGGGMPTTTAIFARLANGAEIPHPGAFSESAVAPSAPTGRTLAEIEAILPVPDGSNGATPAEVVGGRTFWSLRPDSTWGLRVGSADCGADTGLYNSPQFTVAELTTFANVIYSVRPNEGGMQYTSDLTKNKEIGTTELQLKLDVVVPPNATADSPQPLVVWIHGGSFQIGGKEDSFTLLLSYARAGYIVASVNYRLIPNEKLSDLRAKAVKQAAEDVMNAFRFLKVNAATYHIDPTRIATIGGSAGGLLVLLNALEYDTFAGAVSDFPGISSRVSAACTTGITLVGNGFDPETFLHYENTDTPVLLFHAKPTDYWTGATWSGNALPTQSLINGSGNTCTVVAQPDMTHTIDWSLGGRYWGYIRAFFWKNLRLNEML